MKIIIIAVVITKIYINDSNPSHYRYDNNDNNNNGITSCNIKKEQ